MNHADHRDAEPILTDPLLGDEETVAGAPVQNPELVLELTLSLDTNRVLSAAARAANLSLPRYILRSAMQMAERDLAQSHRQ
jgi:hypothetical protein